MCLVIRVGASRFMIGKSCLIHQIILLKVHNLKPCFCKGKKNGAGMVKSVYIEE